jgi:hypothetical protein
MWWVGAAIVLLAAAAGMCADPRGFPLRPGDWEISTTPGVNGQPLVTHLCFTSETWLKGLTQNPSCKIEDISVTSKGMHYVVNCEMRTVQMKGPVDLTFDGMEHMTGKASVAVIRLGKTTTSETVSDYRWKNAACTSADASNKAKSPR